MTLLLLADSKWLETGLFNVPREKKRLNTSMKVNVKTVVVLLCKHSLPFGGTCSSFPHLK